MDWLEELTAFASDQLGEHEREVLWGRGVTDEQIALYRIGHLRRQLPDLQRAGLFMEWSGNGRKLDDVFVLPLTNAMNQVRGFQFRYVDRARKGYMDFFADETEPVMFGLGQALPHAWKSGSMWIVEGGFDLFPIQRVYPEIIATLTARVPEHLVRLLRRFVDDVWIAYDMDKAGLRGTYDFIEEYGSEFRTHKVQLPRVRKVDGSQSKDPSDVWEAWGDARLGVFLRQLQSPL